jgi:ParB-like chromosome segregation protein Spo0J
VLARLESVEGVADVRVEATGRWFALTLAAGAEEAAVLAGAAAALRKPPRRLAPGEAAAQLARRDAGDPWLSRREIATLCYLEARMLAARGAAEVGAAAGLSPPEREAVDGAFRAVLFEAMERVLAEGGRDSSGWFCVEWPALSAAVAARCAAALAPERRGPAAEALAALHAR